MYSPSNIKRPSEFPQNALTNPDHSYHCFGKFEYEIIAQRLLDISQQGGEWVTLFPYQFIPPFRDIGEANRRLMEMADETGLLTRDRGKFELTKSAIDVLFENYPSENGSD